MRTLEQNMSGFTTEKISLEELTKADISRIDDMMRSGRDADTEVGVTKDTDIIFTRRTLASYHKGEYDTHTVTIILPEVFKRVLKQVDNNGEDRVRSNIKSILRIR